ncbi:MAG TPA: hypothetical protein PLE77_09295 [Kiritimatiellia bacterium]|nr:hypothetical protein [Kiritimatiellia bacterium]
MKSWLTKYRMHLALLVFVVAVITLMVASFHRFIVKRRQIGLALGSFEERILAIPDFELQHFASTIYDPDTGWDTRPLFSWSLKNSRGKDWRFSIDAIGSRTNSHPGEALISSYGDSFTFCDEVNDDQTWQRQLSDLVNAKVLNFGRMGYGTDQALLRLEKNLRNGIHTKIVVLAFMTEDINRIINLYRPFLTKAPTDTLYFKPAFVQSATAAYTLVNPLPEPPDSRDDLLRALAVARQHDYWWNATQGDMIALRTTAGMPWNNPAVLSTLEFLIERFVGLSRENDFTPVLLLIPYPSELEFHAAGTTGYYGSFVNSLNQEYSHGPLIIVDMMKQPFEETKFNMIPYPEGPSHASEYGNRVIANAIYSALKASGALDAHR